jgi:hypothetical protein
MRRSPEGAAVIVQVANRPLICSVGVMRIDVIDEDESAPARARAYAEYRLFATLARHARGIRSVRVVLHVAHKGLTDRASCVITVVLEPSGSAVARAYGRHVHGAIDRAAGRIGDLINRKAPQITQS